MDSWERVRLELDPALAEVVILGVQASGCRLSSSPAVGAAERLGALIEQAVAAVRAQPPDEATRRAVRDLLRHGKYKPTGRAKPASEYLAGAALDGSFPRVSTLVDVNNLVSLESMLPASIIDLERAGTRQFRIRRGRQGEAYVFNPAGQTIELRDLLLVATAPDDRPCANPVKDAMATKVVEGTTHVLALVYAPRSLADRARAAARRYADLLTEHARPKAVHTVAAVLPGSSEGRSI